MRSPAKKYWKELVLPGDVAIDATCGNGRDTLFLSALCLQVFSFDIQKEALQNTEELLRNNLSPEQLKNVTLLHRSHATMNEIVFPKPPRLIVYNLGYLPGGDKEITTQTATTLASIEQGLHLLSPDGALSITCYPGHEEGAKEETAIEEIFSALSPKKWAVCHHRYVNRSKAPSLFWVRSTN